MESLASNSSMESFGDELKALYDDHDYGTRWVNQFTATPQWIPHPNINITKVLNDFDKSSYPAGSDVDIAHLMSPVDLYDSQYLNLAPTVYSKAETTQAYVENDLLDRPK